MAMGLSILIGVFVCYVPVLALWALLCNWLARMILRPLSVPKEMTLEFKRDRLATFVFFIPWLSIVIAPIIYLIALIRHLRERRAGVVVASSTLPRIPSIALSEMLVMVFSIGAYPLIMSKLQFSNAFGMGHMTDEMRAWLFVAAAPLFPLCFASAYLRLDSNKVPRGVTRHEFLFLFPYAMFGLQTLISIALATIFVLPLLLVANRHEAMTDEAPALLWFAQVLGAALLMVILTVLVARRAKREAEAHAAAAEPPPATAAPAEPAVPPQPAASVGEKGTWTSPT